MEIRRNLRKLTELGIALTAISALILAGCGGGGGGGTSAAPGAGPGTATTGTVYPVVVGLTYQTNSTSGVIASNGSYTYKGNENVTFRVGGIELATVPAAAKVTPLPLDNDVASTNLLRLFKGLDTGAASGVFSLPPLATSWLPQLASSSSVVDLSSASSVAAALASLVPTAVLPSASDVQVTTTLAAAKTTALQNMGTYGPTYTTLVATPLAGVTPLAYQPKSAVVTLTSQPNWVTGAVNGTATLTLNDNSQVTFSFTGTQGTYTALGNTQTFSLTQDYAAKSRIIYFYYGNVVAAGGGTGVQGQLILRDNAQPNMAPVPGIGIAGQCNGCYSFTPALAAGQPDTYTFNSIPALPGGVMNGSKDFDGLVVSQSWSSSKGKTGTGNTFSESFLWSETGSITLTVTDDQGATASRTYQINPGAAASLTAAQFYKQTAGNTWVWADTGGTTKTRVMGAMATAGITNTETIAWPAPSAPTVNTYYTSLDAAGNLVVTTSTGVTSTVLPAILQVGKTWTRGVYQATVTGINTAHTVAGLGTFYDVMALATTSTGCTATEYWSMSVGELIDSTKTCTSATGVVSTTTTVLKPGYIAK